MEISSELANLFGSELDKVELVELTYQNGGKVIGTIKKVRQKPLKVVIQKSKVEKGERPKHKVVFDHVIQLLITFRGGSTKIFE